MKFLSSLFLACAFALTACAQFTTTPPDKHGSGFTWTTAPARRAPDAEAKAFIARAGLSSGTETRAIADLVHELKKTGVWTNLFAFYPFVGGTSQACAQNLLSTNYTITWRGTLTYNASGVRGDSATGYGDTGYNPRTAGANSNSFHLYVYYATNGIVGGPMIGVRDGSVGAGQPGATWLSYNSPFKEISFEGVFYGAAGGNDTAVGRNFVIQRLMVSGSPTNVVINHDFSRLYYGSPGAIQSPPNTNIFVLSMPYGGGYGDANLRAASFGKGLSDTQITNYFDAVTRFQTALGRATP